MTRQQTKMSDHKLHKMTTEQNVTTKSLSHYRLD